MSRSSNERLRGRSNLSQYATRPASHVDVTHPFISGRRNHAHASKSALKPNAGNADLPLRFQSFRKYGARIWLDMSAT